MTEPTRSTQYPPKRQSAAQKANDANRLQQMAINGKTTRPGDRRSAQPGEASTEGLADNNQPVGIARRK